MNNYKDFDFVQLGFSDIASLTLRCPGQADVLSFGSDGSYRAYECFGEEVIIGEHYNLVFEGESWLKIYDDNSLVYYHYYSDFTKFSIYRAGEFGCIIHWHN